MGQGEIPESGEHLLTPTEIPSQIPTKLEEVGNYVVGDKLTREDMVRTWLTKDPLGRDDRDLLVWNHRLNHCSFKYLLRLSKRGAIPRNLIDIRKPLPCVACLFGKCHKRPWSKKGKLSGGSTSKPSDTRPRAMTSIFQTVYSQPGITPPIHWGSNTRKISDSHRIHGSLL